MKKSIKELSTKAINNTATIKGGEGDPFTTVEFDSIECPKRKA